MICSICERDFDIDAEGGVSGYFGIIPVAFCPECYACCYDMIGAYYEEESNE